MRTYKYTHTLTQMQIVRKNHVLIKKSKKPKAKQQQNKFEFMRLKSTCRFLFNISQNYI